MSSTLVGRQLIHGLRKASERTADSALATFADHLEKKSVGALDQVDAATLQRHLDTFSGLTAKDQRYVETLIGKLRGPEATDTASNASKAKGPAAPALSPEEEMRRLLGAAGPSGEKAKEPEVSLTLFEDIVSGYPSDAEDKLAKAVKQAFARRGFNGPPSRQEARDLIRDAFVSAGELTPEQTARAVTRALTALRDDRTIPSFDALGALSDAGLEIPAEAVDAAWAQADSNVSDAFARAFTDRVQPKNKQARKPTADEVAKRILAALEANTPSSEAGTVPERFIPLLHAAMEKAVAQGAFPGQALVERLRESGLTVPAELETKAWEATLAFIRDEVEGVLQPVYGDTYHAFLYPSRKETAEALEALLDAHTPKGQTAQRNTLFTQAVLDGVAQALDSGYATPAFVQLDALSDLRIELPEALLAKAHQVTAARVAEEVERAFTLSPPGTHPTWRDVTRPDTALLAQRLGLILQQHTPAAWRTKPATLHEEAFHTALRKLDASRKPPSLLELGTVLELGITLPPEVEASAWAGAEKALQAHVKRAFHTSQDRSKSTREQVRDHVRGLIDQTVPACLQAAYQDRIHAALLEGMEEAVGWPSTTLDQLAAFEELGFPLSQALMDEALEGARHAASWKVKDLLGKDNRDEDVAAQLQGTLERRAPPEQRGEAVKLFEPDVLDGIRECLAKGPVRLDRVSAIESLGVEIPEALKAELLEKAQAHVTSETHKVLVTPIRKYKEPDRMPTADEIRAHIRSVVRTHRPTSGAGSEPTYFARSIVEGVKKAVASPFPPEREALAAVETLLRSDGFLG